jgi:hypothetical protein
MKFQPGQSGNPAGRPVGSKNKITELQKLLVPHAEELVAKAVEMALAGDSAALRLCIDRLIPSAKARDATVSVPGLTGSLADSGRIVLDALAAEEITPEQASKVLQAIATQARIVEVDEIEKRVAALEQAAGGKPNG